MPSCRRLVGHVRARERNAERVGERDDARDGIGRDAGAQQRRGVGVEQRRRIARVARDVDRDVVGERLANQLAVERRGCRATPPLVAPSDFAVASVNWSDGGSNVKKPLRR